MRKSSMRWKHKCEDSRYLIKKAFSKTHEKCAIISLNVVSDLSLIKICIYLKRTNYRKRRTESSFICLFTAPMAATAKLDLMGAGDRSQELLLGLLLRLRDTRTWICFQCFPWCIGRELNQKHIGQNRNW